MASGSTSHLSQPVPSTSTQLMQTARTNTQLMFVDLKKCANHACKRTKISAKCAKGLCAMCCVMLLDACTYAAHDRKRAQEHAARQSQPRLHGPWSVMHPLPADIPDTNRIRPPAPSASQLPPAIGTQLPVPSIAEVDHSQLDSEPAEAFEHRHRKQFQNSYWKDSWMRQEADHRQREDAETLRRENLIAMKQSFRLAYWGNNADAAPLRMTINYILTWPMFSLLQSLEFLALLDLSADDYIDINVHQKISISKLAMFAQIFPGVGYSESNLYANWKFWTACTEQKEILLDRW
ncbi:hypothetical protein C8Q80DRAFT_1267463 [Daedaleopsis nitida]|nr:hypothetical protein C8Q80DRAFT_1267463 [Daedaleopsis nitida]